MLIGMRNAMFGGAKLSAKSYVQDGLVAMWDGIENAGWGVHDPSATVWKDLVGSYDLTLPTNGSWTDNSFARNTGVAGAKSSLYPSTSGRKFVEACFRYSSGGGTSSNGYRIIVFRFGTSDAQTAGGISVFNLSSGGYALSTYPNWQYEKPYAHMDSLGAQTVGIDVSNYVPQAFYVNGSAIVSSGSVKPGYGDNWTGTSIGSRGEDSTGTFVGDVYNVRLYSRALTADEADANYAVDKARFNLPDAT